MPASIAEFAKAAEDSGILTPESLAEYVQGVAPDTDATALANRLVKDGRLTAFQAKYIYGGKADSLVLGPYIVLDMLGRGGMGYVYKAEHRKMRRVVALKVIAKTALKSPAAVRRFEREVQAAARLEHPNIVTAFDAGEAAGTHYLVMQFVDGRNLSEVVKELGPQPVGRAVDWILQAARGLAFAHEQGVIHRDIKPGNLLVDSRGTVKILDMGLARLETLDADQDQLTGTGQIMGTVDYMAPEQAMDTRQADARSDIYSLGVTLWYLLTGRPLFTGETVMGKMMAHMQTPAPPLASASGDVPPEIDAVFQRMVAKKPADRFQSMQEVIAALQSLPQSETTAGPPSIDFRGGLTSLGPLGGADIQVIPQPKAVAADENTVRLSAIDIDTAVGRKKMYRKTRRPKARVKSLNNAIGGGAVGALLLLGIIMFAFRGLPKPKTVHQGGGSAPQSSSRLDAVASVAIAEPTTSPPTEPQATASPPIVRPSTTPPPAIAPFDAMQARKHQEAWAKHLGIEVETTNSIGQTLVVIPPGRFTMGEGDKTVDVTLTKPFLLGQTEVTQGQWKEVMGTEPWWGQKYLVEGTDVAATTMSWTDAVIFCERLTSQERDKGRIDRGQEYRLPTEAEWEFACRAGTTTMFSFGDDESMLGDFAWFGGGWDGEKNLPTSGGSTGSEMYAHAVRLKRPNPFGLFDVHGNAGEWCRDWMAPYPQTAMTDPTGPPSETTQRIYRGGSWPLEGLLQRSASRLGFRESFRSIGVGFRTVLTISQPSTIAKTAKDISTPPPPAIAPFDAMQARRHQEAWAKHLGIEVETTNSIGQTLVVIPPSRFTIRWDQIAVTLTKPFLLGQTEVTQGQWKEVMGTEPWKGEEYTIEGTDVAATFVSWDDAVAFCAKLTERERGNGKINHNQQYRLPTAAEWEFAGRAGTITFGDDEGILGEYAWFGGGWGNEKELRKPVLIPGGNTAGERYAHAVRLKQPNPFGIYDMQGNVWEWCNDWKGEYGGVVVTDPQGPSEGSERVRRGGSWTDSALNCQLPRVHAAGPLWLGLDQGFRVVLSPPDAQPLPTEAGE